MSIPEGSHTIGPSNGSLRVKTGREGAASKAGHDLTLEVTTWEATVEGGDSPSIKLTADPTSIDVREGTGGAKKLGDGDKQDIRKTIDKDILKQQHITFTSTSCQRTNGGLTVSGDLQLVGTTKPVSFELSESGGTVTGTATVKQSDWGIKPYSALFGALKVDDEVQVVVEGQLSK